MREFGKIGSVIWRSKKFLSLRSDDSRLAYFYLHTNELGNAVGCYCLPEPVALSDLHWTKPRYRKAIADLVRVNLIETDTEEQCVSIVNFLRFNRPQNRSHLIGMYNFLSKVPSQTLAEKRRKELNRLRTRYRHGVETVSTYQDRDSDSKKESSKKERPGPAPPPAARNASAAPDRRAVRANGKHRAKPVQEIPPASTAINAAALTPEELAQREAEAIAFIASMPAEKGT